MDCQPATILPVEVLEDIFLYLPAWELMMSVTVCTYWRDVYESSKRIRAHLSAVHTTRATPLLSGFNRGAKSPWLLRTKASNGSLFLARDQARNLEVVILAHKRPELGRYLRVLDDRSKCRCVWSEKKLVLGASWKAGPTIIDSMTPDLEWWDQQTGHLITKTMTRPSRACDNALRSYFLLYYAKEGDAGDENFGWLVEPGARHLNVTFWKKGGKSVGWKLVST